MNSTVIPSMRYRDCPAAIAFLCDAFGFEQHLVVPGPDNVIVHAQLTFGKLGRGMVMCSSVASNPEYGEWIQPPPSPGAVLTHGLYLIVPDVDGHYAKAVAAGARVLMEPADQDYGGRLYTCLDPEGYIWSFGSYNPWA